MKKLLIVGVVVFCAGAGWSLGQKLSADALSMAIGVFFGILAGIPAALLVMAATRRSERQPEPRKVGPEPVAPAYQPPVIVVSPPFAGGMGGYGAGNNMSQNYLPSPAAMSAQPSRREFRMVGTDEDWVDEG